MVQQIEITLQPKRRGFHLVTSEILSQLPKLPKTGIVNIFTKHTSCGLSINENCDPDVRVDMETIFNRMVPENRPEYEHTLEGADEAVVLGTDSVLISKQKGRKIEHFNN